MGTKTISIMDDVYKMLARNKKRNESFSDLLRRTFNKKGDISRFVGAWQHIPDRDIDEMKAAIKRVRANADKRLRNDLP
ncbi:antitoxin [Candidatus Woesearchaeota archaeon]|nr:MAG: antitoxin [Candidatus Woesearchaeota archaeon]